MVESSSEIKIPETSTVSYSSAAIKRDSNILTPPLDSERPIQTNFEHLKTEITRLAESLPNKIADMSQLDELLSTYKNIKEKYNLTDEQFVNFVAASFGSISNKTILALCLRWKQIYPEDTQIIESSLNKVRKVYSNGISFDPNLGIAFRCLKTCKIIDLYNTENFSEFVIRKSTDTLYYISGYIGNENTGEFLFTTRSAQSQKSTQEPHNASFIRNDIELTSNDNEVTRKKSACEKFFELSPEVREDLFNFIQHEKSGEPLFPEVPPEKQNINLDEFQIIFANPEENN